MGLAIFMTLLDVGAGPARLRAGAGAGLGWAKEEGGGEEALSAKTTFRSIFVKNLII